VAIVKLVTVDGEPRVLTKTVDGEVRVSCSCCAEAECCMYPALGYGDAYTYEDLPDQILVRPGTTGGFSEGVIALKQNEGDDYLYVSSPYNASGGDLQIWEFRWRSFSFGPRWAYRSRFTYQELSVGVNEGGGGLECLIGQSFEGGIFVGAFTEDDFADAYTITTNGESVEVTRQSLCLWAGEDACGYVWQLAYGATQWQANEYTWNVYVNENTAPCSAPNLFTERKDGFQNTPVGDYGGGNVTVSE
jgi:hypothetical protein